MIFKKSKKKTTKFQRTGNRNKRFIQGVIISAILIATPFLFYLYRFAPKSDSWDLGLFIIYSGGFKSVIGFVHAFFTKVTFLIITTIWFFTARQWWRFAILIPFGMFFFQLSGVINQNIRYTDDFSFWKSLIILGPILIGMIMYSIKLNQKTQLLDIREQVKKEMEAIKNERKAS
ncbi:hypothetical protein [uncultured Aquimarina sp.]|uniref:hypothetical protein n=1 Tax=uncultured Aquimarina sp. TaxID=575652 RepID=UPI0026258B74|nr:hypothetical protein [uncultured Aquimarina sp.]